MKRAIISFVCIALFAYVVWWIGIALEFEYPYTLTLMHVRSAVSVNGVPVSQIIRSRGIDTQGIHWHTCSYCAHAFGDHKNLVLVRLDGADKSKSYYFAYCRPTHVLVPLMDLTAKEFPSLMPPADELRPVGELDGTGRTSSFGEGELKLPKNWYGKATGAVASTNR